MHSKFAATQKRFYRGARGGAGRDEGREEMLTIEDGADADAEMKEELTGRDGEESEEPEEHDDEFEVQEEEEEEEDMEQEGGEEEEERSDEGEEFFERPVRLDRTRKPPPLSAADEDLLLSSEALRQRLLQGEQLPEGMSAMTMEEEAASGISGGSAAATADEVLRRPPSRLVEEAEQEFENKTRIIAARPLRGGVQMQVVNGVRQIEIQSHEEPSTQQVQHMLETHDDIEDEVYNVLYRYYVRRAVERGEEFPVLGLTEMDPSTGKPVVNPPYGRFVGSLNDFHLEGEGRAAAAEGLAAQSLPEDPQPPPAFRRRARLHLPRILSTNDLGVPYDDPFANATADDVAKHQQEYEQAVFRVRGAQNSLIPLVEDVFGRRWLPFFVEECEKYIMKRLSIHSELGPNRQFHDLKPSAQCGVLHRRTIACNRYVERLVSVAKDVHPALHNPMLYSFNQRAGGVGGIQRHYEVQAVMSDLARVFVPDPLPLSDSQEDRQGDGH